MQIIFRILLSLIKNLKLVKNTIYTKYKILNTKYDQGFTRQIFISRNLVGFTLVEMLVTLSIVTLLTSMVLVYSRKSESVTNLIRESDRLVYELRRAQNLAMLTLQNTDNTNSSSDICGWGIYLNPNEDKTSYFLFNDFCNTGIRGQYDVGEESEKINLIKGIIIDSSNISSVTFVPPEPQIKFYPPLNGNDDALIKLCLETNLSNCFTIHITQAGQIYKE